MFYISISDEMRGSDFVRDALCACGFSPGDFDGGLLEVIPKSSSSDIMKLLNWRYNAR